MSVYHEVKTESAHDGAAVMYGLDSPMALRDVGNSEYGNAAWLGTCGHEQSGKT